MRKESPTQIQVIPIARTILTLQEEYTERHVRKCTSSIMSPCLAFQTVASFATVVGSGFIVNSTRNEEKNVL